MNSEQHQQRAEELIDSIGKTLQDMRTPHLGQSQHNQMLRSARTNVRALGTHERHFSEKQKLRVKQLREEVAEMTFR